MPISPDDLQKIVVQMAQLQNLLRGDPGEGFRDLAPRLRFRERQVSFTAGTTNLLPVDPRRFGIIFSRNTATDFWLTTSPPPALLKGFGVTSASPILEFRWHDYGLLVMDEWVGISTGAGVLLTVVDCFYVP